jgi:hypothetical protein
MGRRVWFPYESRTPYESEGVNDAWLVHRTSIGKECSEDSPYLIPNEWIAGNIAQFLRLPIPPFALTRNDPSHKGMFASLRFGTKQLHKQTRETQPRDMIPEPCVRNDPELCTGILLFDIYVANGDRNRSNLKVNDPFNPTDFNIFDHERSLFFVEAKQGKKRLDEMLTALGVSRGSVSGHSQHCFLDAITTDEHFYQWISKIASIRDWFIDEICHEMNDWLTEDEIEAVILFLKYRKDNLVEIIRKHKSKFRIKDWGILV